MKTEYQNTPETPESLFEQHRRLVRRYIDKSFRRLPPSVDRDDLESIALETLWACAKRYDRAFGTPFWAYACQTIRRRILDRIRENDWTSRRSRNRHSEAVKKQTELSCDTGREVSLEEACQALGLDRRQTLDVRRIAETRFLSLDDLRKIQGTPMAEAIADWDMQTPSEALCAEEDADRLRQCLDWLAPKRRSYIAMHFIEGLTQNEIAERLKRNPSGICSAIKEGLEQLREYLTGLPA